MTNRYPFSPLKITSKWATRGVEHQPVYHIGYVHSLKLTIRPPKMVGISKFGISKLPGKSSFSGARMYSISFTGLHQRNPFLQKSLVGTWSPYSWMVSYTSCILNMIFVPYTYIRLVWIVLPTTPRHQKYYIQQTWLDMEHSEHMVHFDGSASSSDLSFKKAAMINQTYPQLKSMILHTKIDLAHVFSPRSSSFFFVFRFERYVDCNNLFRGAFKTFVSILCHIPFVPPKGPLFFTQEITILGQRCPSVTAFAWWIGHEDAAIEIEPSEFQAAWRAKLELLSKHCKTREVYSMI